MSFDLGVWHSDEAIGEEEARDIYSRLCDGEAVFAGDSPDISAFYREITSQYPELDTVPENEVDASPWACALERPQQDKVIVQTR